MAVYDGGWLEWSQDPTNLIETSIPAALAEAEVQAYVQQRITNGPVTVCACGGLTLYRL